ncbi:hypothetical protein P3342_006103 [Pyrenophora teres f. teres]|nr:hypothetical protein P3342_006103 [Pyrenophora teres f. teres]
MTTHIMTTHIMIMHMMTTHMLKYPSPCLSLLNLLHPSTLPPSQQDQRRRKQAT